MRIFATLFLVAAFVAATTPCRAEATIPLPVQRPTAPAPHFIKHGTPLTMEQVANLNQRVVVLGHFSLDAAGDDDAIPTADAVFIGIVVIAVIGGLVYLAILESQQTSKLF